ncbi:hypothetical protein QC764_0076980 [Podospora pseudoanserina]|uniref:Chitin-binding type-1 domain-containing protein n=1 Tax=Podospora pseudoanserina TaxID=2609844 RepID=A0ABR0I4N7_9PEZI|nr:hypothetical protein QC764_0076980 [Podospora pseudoanserina]
MRASWATLLGLLAGNLGGVLSQSPGDPPAWQTGVLTDDGSCGPNSLEDYVCTPTWGACCGADGRRHTKNSQQGYGNCNIPWTGVPSPDGSCGYPNLYNCTNSGFGSCCSSTNWCGDSPGHCGAGCQSLFGICTESNVSTDGSCGPANGKTCTGSGFGDCCSAGGWCGGASDHCGAGCQSGFGTCTGGSGSISTDGECGTRNGKTCTGSGFGNCCSQNGFCGSTTDHCSAGCQSGFGTCSGGSGSISTDGTCGYVNKKTCIGSGFGNCCSSSGNCGTTTAHCGAGCQSSYGTCNSGSGTISTDGKCGSNGKTCTGSGFGNCCSSSGNCGGTVDHCAVGCQPSFGTCLSGSGSISTDGKCGSNGKTCVGSAFGNCCSATGNCGGTANHCGQGW